VKDVHDPGRRRGARRPEIDRGLDVGDQIFEDSRPSHFSPVHRRVGQNLVELRLEAGSSRVAIGEVIGFGYQQIRNLEIGGSELSIPNAARLAVHYGVPIDRLAAGVFWVPGDSQACGEAAGPPPAGHFFVESPQETAARMRPSVEITHRDQLAPLIGEAIRDARRRRRLPQHALGLKQSHVSRFERGLEEPTLETLIGIARELEVSVEWLLGGASWLHTDQPPGGPSRRTAIGRGPTAIRPPERRARRPAEHPELTFRQVKAVVGETARFHREAAGLGRRVFGEAVGSSEWMVGKIERDGLHRISALVRWATVLGMPCALLTAGIEWDGVRGAFVSAGEPRRIGLRPATSVGANVRAIRRRQGLSMESVARRVGGHRTHFQMIEHGTRIPRPVTVLKLASALGVGLDVLCEGVRDWLVRPLPPPEVEESELPGLAADRQARALDLWRSGATLEEIGTEVELAASGAFEVLDGLRQIGVAVPYRQRPASAAQLSTRLRRRRNGRPPHAPIGPTSG
jgi:transcriptional regulator with XRE-family HTH domain